MKTSIWRHIAAVVCGIICLIVASSVATLILTLLGSVPILGAILFYPSDAAWSLVVVPPIFSVYATAKVSNWIAGDHRPTMIAVLIIHILGAIGLCIGDSFTVHGLISYILGAGLTILTIVHKEID
jgi:hypothetical protein